MPQVTYNNYILPISYLFWKILVSSLSEISAVRLAICTSIRGTNFAIVKSSKHINIITNKGMNLHIAYNFTCMIFAEIIFYEFIKSLLEFLKDFRETKSVNLRAEVVSTSSLRLCCIFYKERFMKLNWNKGKNSYRLLSWFKYIYFSKLFVFFPI